MDLKFFQFGATRLMFDSTRVALFEVDGVAEQALRGRLADGEVPESLRHELEALRARGCFSRADLPPEDAAAALDIRPRIDSITLGLTHACNLRCDYCFGERYLEGGGEDSATVLRVGRHCLDLLHENLSAGRAKRVSLVFFGGEPLLRFDLLQELVAYGEERFGEAVQDLTFGITTNAALLDVPTATYLRDHRITPLVSVDGGQAAHDRYRRDADGRGSFEVLRRNLLAAREVGLGFGARVTITNHNTDLPAVMEELDGLGFFSYKFSPLCGAERHALTPESVRALAASYARLADRFIADVSNGRRVRFSLFDPFLSALHFSRERVWCCDAGARSVSVGPDGEVYACYKLAGELETRIGRIDDAVLPVSRPNCDHAARVERIAECEGCWIRGLCGGHCFADRYNAGKWRERRSFDVHCSLNRIAAAESVRIIHELTQQAPDRLRRYLEPQGRKEA